MLFNELGKMKRSSIMTSIILMAVGLMMIICPKDYVISLIDGLGYGMVILAAVLILDYISSKKSLMNFIWLTSALVVLLIGMAVVVFNDGDTTILRILSWLFGLFLLIDGSHTMVHAVVYARRAQRRGWQVLIVLASLLLIFGLILFLNLIFGWWNTPKALLVVIGWLMLFASAVGIARLIWVWPIKTEKEG